MAGFLLPNEMPYCKHDRHIKGGQKTIAFLCRFFRPTSDVNISKTVYPIYLKIKVQRVPTSHSSHINFQVNRITRFRDIDVGSWPKKSTKKHEFYSPRRPPFSFISLKLLLGRYIIEDQLERLSNNFNFRMRLKINGLCN